LLPPPSRVNSTRVAGGDAPPPLHSTAPEPQSPVTHEKRPDVGSDVHSVRAHNRPDQEGGTSTARISPGCSLKPVVASGASPALERIPGHIAYWQLFVTLKVADFVPIIGERYQGYFEFQKKKISKYKENEKWPLIKPYKFQL
jgi:hypothetical protein